MESTFLNRRSVLKGAAAAAVLSMTRISAIAAPSNPATYPIRLGGPVFDKYESPDQWVRILKGLGYRAAYCPVKAHESDDVVKAYANAAKEANIVIAEVGAWSNPISNDEKQRKDALAKCRKQLELADGYELSSTLVSGLNWLTWICVENRSFASPDAVLARIQAIAGRMETLVKNR